MIPVIIVIIIIITKNNPLQLKEKKINQLRVNKIKLNKKNSKVSKGEMQTSGLIIMKKVLRSLQNYHQEWPINGNKQTPDTELTKNDFEEFWRPIWEDHTESNLDAMDEGSERSHQ